MTEQSGVGVNCERAREISAMAESDREKRVETGLTSR